MKKHIGLVLAAITVITGIAYAELTNDFKITKERIDKMVKQQAVITMEKGGEIVIDFFPKEAPNTVANFIELTEKNYYDGLTFHRVVPKFVAQGGDPSGNGTGGPGYQIKAEFNKNPHLKGTVAMARSMDPDSAGSQFYICLEPQPYLDGQYTVFGQVAKGMDIVDKIQIGDKMKSVKIIEKGKAKDKAKAK
ncbi:MAG: peptidylprolyl isomerase [Candidatus Margulisiibacteriota bacterium]|nr:MAG: peptidylprolyl isomerase [Candidatus Margulisiibacteriota bacterium]HCT85098.1 peptidylprolyl isomerase [Candidatus Margulisiibacteriota bacterium]HCY35891.1 peptidylprolyl isomerase [Candidatus Margulisiibacteriota bacterium]